MHDCWWQRPRTEQEINDDLPPPLAQRAARTRLRPLILDAIERALRRHLEVRAAQQRANVVRFFMNGREDLLQVGVVELDRPVIPQIPDIREQLSAMWVAGSVHEQPGTLQLLEQHLQDLQPTLERWGDLWALTEAFSRLLADVHPLRLASSVREAADPTYVASGTDGIVLVPACAAAWRRPHLDGDEAVFFASFPDGFCEVRVHRSDYTIARRVVGPPHAPPLFDIE